MRFTAVRSNSDRDGLQNRPVRSGPCQYPWTVKEASASERRRKVREKRTQRSLAIAVFSIMQVTFMLYSVESQIGPFGGGVSWGWHDASTFPAKQVPRGQATRAWHLRRFPRNQGSAPCRCRMAPKAPLPTPLERDNTMIAVIEIGQASWLVAGIVPGREPQPLKEAWVRRAGAAPASAALAEGGGPRRH